MASLPQCTLSFHEQHFYYHRAIWAMMIHWECYPKGILLHAAPSLASQGRYSLLFSRDTHQFVPSTAPGSFSLEACHGNSDSVLNQSFPHLFYLRPSVAEVKGNLQARQYIYASCWFQSKLTNSFLEPTNLFTTTFGQKTSEPFKNIYSLKQK